MIRRIAVVVIAVLALGALAGGGTSAVAKKKKKPKIALGAYNGMTSNGIQMSVTVDAGRASGSMSYCGMIAPFTIAGNSFSVAYIDPTMNSITASGTFNPKLQRVTGTVAPNGCDSTQQTFSLSH